MFPIKLCHISVLIHVDQNKPHQYIQCLLQVHLIHVSQDNHFTDILSLAFKQYLLLHLMIIQVDDHHIIFHQYNQSVSQTDQLRVSLETLQPHTLLKNCLFNTQPSLNTENLYVLLTGEDLHIPHQHTPLLLRVNLICGLLGIRFHHAASLQDFVMVGGRKLCPHLKANYYHKIRHQIMVQIHPILDFHTFHQQSLRFNLA